MLAWGPEGLGETAAVRWKNQFNENAKVPAFVGVLPELDHNEIEGWSVGSGTRFGAGRTAAGARAPVGRPARRRDARRDRAVRGRRARGPGRDGSPMAQLFTLIALGDFVSTYLAVRRGVDPTPVPVLTKLKEDLRA